jgi:hypothetical protein
MRTARTKDGKYKCEQVSTVTLVAEGNFEMMLATDLWLWEDFFLKSTGTWSSLPKLVIMVLVLQSERLSMCSATDITLVFLLPCRLNKLRLPIDLTTYTLHISQRFPS